MIEVVGGYALSHSSFMVSQPELAPSAARERVFAAYGQVRDEIAQLSPDLLILIGTDHFNTFFGAPMPQWCVGVQDSYEGWGDNVPLRTLAGNRILSLDLCESLLDAGLEVAWSNDLKLDHSFIGPLHFVSPDLSIPVVPIFQNTIDRPMLTPRRAYEFGRGLRQSLLNSPHNGRAIVIGSGGLSHWIGNREHGRLNTEFDNEFVSRFCAEDVEWLSSLTTDSIYEAAGNGGQEIRNWLTVRPDLAHVAGFSGGATP